MFFNGNINFFSGFHGEFAIEKQTIKQVNGNLFY